MSDSDDEEASLACPKRTRTAASKVTDPSNRSTPALSSHRDAAAAARIAAATATTTKATGGSGLLSTVGSASNSRSVSPGKRNADDAALSSKSSGSDGMSTQDKRKGKGKQKGKRRGGAMTPVTNSDVA